MSSDSAKETVPLLDSSVTECKRDVVKMHDPGIPSDRLDEEAGRSGAKEQGQSCDVLEPSREMKNDIHNTRYFIIKSLYHQNIELSVKRGIWATQVMNEPILEDAFQNSGKVILIFSVNSSRSFQGYAQMLSSVGWRRDHIWSQGTGKNNPWGRSFKVKWLRLCDLPFQKTLHLINPWNDFKPVKVSRDCQELPPEIGEALRELLDGGDAYMNRDDAYEDNFPRGHYVGPQHSVEDGAFYVPPVHMGHFIYPSQQYQHQSGANPYNLPYQRTSDVNNSSIIPAISRVRQPRRRQLDGRSAMRTNNYSRLDSLGFPAEGSSLTATVTEEDILDMTYEEYLEAHAQCKRRLDRSASGRPRQKSSSSKDCSDDSHSGSSSKKRRRYRQSLD